MSSASAIPDSNPTRAQLRLVVLAQWVRAGLDLAWRATARGGLVGGAVALWRIWQAVRLARLLAQRLSETESLPTGAALETPSGEPAAWSLGSSPEHESVAAACLRDALAEMLGTLRDALGLAPQRRPRPGTARAAAATAALELPRGLGRPTSPRRRPADRPPSARRRSLRTVKTTPPPIAAPATGRYRLAAG